MIRVVLASILYIVSTLYLSPHCTMPHKEIYHLVEELKWREACASENGNYLSPTYEQDGFIHATAEAALLLPVANHFFTDVPGAFLCLRIDTDLLKSEVKYEAAAPVGDKSAHGSDGGDDRAGEVPQFPHIYGPITAASVVAELTVTRAEDGRFISIDSLRVS
ncbi:unnamed protein product [Discosporangium mesarthrocarpum]